VSRCVHDRRAVEGASKIIYRDPPRGALLYHGRAPPNARERCCRVRGARVLICLPPAASQRTIGPSGGRSHTRSVELQRDTKISRFLLARNRKFESISLQRRVIDEPYRAGRTHQVWPPAFATSSASALVNEILSAPQMHDRFWTVGVRMGVERPVATLATGTAERPKVFRVVAASPLVHHGTLGSNPSAHESRNKIAFWETHPARAGSSGAGCLICEASTTSRSQRFAQL
jgi:hypothetical protein